MIFEKTQVLLVERFYCGQDYRLVVLDDKVISAYERLPLSLEGDGVNTIKTLLENKQCKFVKGGRDTEINFDDPRLATNLKRQKLSFDSILPKGEKIFLLDNANLSSGGDAIDVTDCLHPDYIKLAVNITKDMNLRLCGVDLIVKGDISRSLSDYAIIEINAAPGLDNYAAMGKVQQKKVEDLYLEVLKALEKK